jgi:hypothetical protein
MAQKRDLLRGMYERLKQLFNEGDMELLQVRTD